MSYFTKPDIQSVSQITSSIKSLLEDEFRFVHIRGEVSNLRRPYSGHLYFTLKDDSSQLKTVLFKGQQKFLESDIEEGQQLVCHGRISIYEPRGDYQLIVDTVDFQGSGRLYLEFEKLKKKLRDEGLFDQSIKKPIQQFPREIVVITSPSGAAIHDFLKICALRQTTSVIKIFPVRVQGEGSGLEISRAIKRVNEELSPDLLVLIRGGGSIEDLWAFNEECVARAIAQSEIPVVTGIGHEIDFTIADFCSDLRTPTPTAAAEQIIFDKLMLTDHIQSLIRRIGLSISTLLDSYEGQVRGFQKLMGNLEPLFSRYSLDLDMRFSRFAHLVNKRLLNVQARFDQLHITLKHQAPNLRLQAYQNRVTHLHERLVDRIGQLFHNKEDNFTRQLMLLDAVSPLATLARGYSISRKKDKITGDYVVVSDSDQIAVQDRLQIILNQGRIECDVVSKQKKEL